MTAQAITDAPPVQAQNPGKTARRSHHIGILRRARALLFGEKKQKLDTGGGHGEMMITIGRGMAPWMMVFFSIAAIIVMGGRSLNALITDMRAGTLIGLDAFSDIGGLAATLMFVFAMDIGMQIAAIKIRDGREAGKKWASLIGYLLFIIAVSATEGGTYIALELRTGGVDMGTLLFIIARAVLIPITALFLGTVTPRVIGRREMEHAVMVEVGSGILTMLQGFAISGQGTWDELAIMLQFFSMMSGMDSKEQAERDTKIVGFIKQLTPSAIEAQAHHQLEAMQREHEARFSDTMRQMLPWLMDVIEHQQWPAELLSYAPEYTRIDPAKVLKAAGIKSAKASTTTQRAPSNSENLADILRDLGVKTVNNPESKRRDMWVATPFITTLSDGKCTGDDARDLARILSTNPDKSGDNYKHNKAYIVPVRVLIRELAKRTQLHSALLEWHNAQQKSEQEEENAA